MWIVVKHSINGQSECWVRENTKITERGEEKQGMTFSFALKTGQGATKYTVTEHLRFSLSMSWGMFRLQHFQTRVTKIIPITLYEIVITACTILRNRGSTSPETTGRSFKLDRTLYLCKIISNSFVCRFYIFIVPAGFCPMQRAKTPRRHILKSPHLIWYGNIYIRYYGIYQSQINLSFYVYCP
jgi:hypothetical protein